MYRYFSKTPLNRLDYSAHFHFVLQNAYYIFFKFCPLLVFISKCSFVLITLLDILDISFHENAM